MKEPREFWISAYRIGKSSVNESNLYMCGDKPTEERTLHVIEKIAYDELKSEAEKLRAENERQSESMKLLHGKYIDLDSEKFFLKEKLERDYHVKMKHYREQFEKQIDQLKREKEIAREGLEKITANRYGFQGLVEDGANEWEMAEYWAKQVQEFRGIALDTLGKMGEK